MRRIFFVCFHFVIDNIVILKLVVYVVLQKICFVDKKNMFIYHQHNCDLFRFQRSPA